MECAREWLFYSVNLRKSQDMKSIQILFATLAAFLVLPILSAHSNGLHCHRCKCECSPQKVCRLVCEMKETTKVTYGCKCEDFCVPGPSQRCQADCACGHCSECKANSWVPTCAKVKTRKVLDKKEEKVMKPTYKWVVEYLCPECAQESGAK